jgi:hypothetical protein
MRPTFSHRAPPRPGLDRCTPYTYGTPIECTAYTTKNTKNLGGDLMKAILQDRYGAPNVLEFSDIDEPVVGEGDVLVRVRAAGCGPDVWHFMTGLPYLARPMIGFRGPKVRVRGWDLAGTVEAVGPNVTRF